MKLIVIFKNQETYTFYGLNEYSIEYGKYLKFTYEGKKKIISIEPKKLYMKDALC